MPNFAQTLAVITWNPKNSSSMKVLEFIKTRNVGLRTLNRVCEFVHIGKKRINSRLTELEIKLIDQTIEEESFETWLKLRNQIWSIEFNRAKSLIKNLNYNAKTEINEDLGFQIIQALQFLTSENCFSSEINKNLNSILNSEDSILDKVSLLKKQKPFTKPDPTKVRKKSSGSKSTGASYKTEIDPYEDFTWGGLSGEEAHTGYWNTE